MKITKTCELAKLVAVFDDTNSLFVVVTSSYLGSEYCDYYKSSYLVRIKLWKKILLLVINGNTLVLTISLLSAIKTQDDGILNMLIRGEYLTVV